MDTTTSLPPSTTQFAFGMSSYRPTPPRQPRELRQTTTFHGSDFWRPEDERRSHEFSFRNSSAAPQYPRPHDHYEPSRDRPRSRHNDEYGRNQRNVESDRRNENGSNFRPRPAQRPQAGFQRGRGNRHVATAARPLLSLKQADIVEQTFGAADDPNIVRRFMQFDEMSDSGEEQMDESDSDQDTSRGPLSQSTEIGSAQPSLEPPVKRRALGIVSNETIAVSQVPKWSNPDPYTSLPPADESRKKKDVVKIIRKARIAVEKGAGVANQAGVNEDFISFGFEETVAPNRRPTRSSRFTPEDHDEVELRVQSPESKRFSHLQNLHGEHSRKAPGTVDMALSTDIKGSPPGLLPKRLPDADIAAFETSQRNRENPLGSRKRTHDDVIKSAPEKSIYELPDNCLIDAWFPGRSTYPTPWLDRSAGRSESVGFRYSPTAPRVVN